MYVAWVQFLSMKRIVGVGVKPRHKQPFWVRKRVVGRIKLVVAKDQAGWGTMGGHALPPRHIPPVSWDFPIYAPMDFRMVDYGWVEKEIPVHVGGRGLNDLS